MSNDLGRIGAIVASRMGSNRLPGKALRQLGGDPMILFLLNRLSSSNLLDKIVLATTQLPQDDILSSTVSNSGFEVFRGSQNNLVSRYVEAASLHELDTVVRVTGDCPFVDGQSLDYCINNAQTSSYFDIATTKGNFPVGLDYEIYPAKIMKSLDKTCQLTGDDREHLTLYFYREASKFNFTYLEPPLKWCTSESYTVDTAHDLMKLQNLVQLLGSNTFSIDALMDVAK